MVAELIAEVIAWNADPRYDLSVEAMRDAARPRGARRRDRRAPGEPRRLRRDHARHRQRPRWDAHVRERGDFTLRVASRSRWPHCAPAGRSCTGLSVTTRSSRARCAARGSPSRRCTSGRMTRRARCTRSTWRRRPGDVPAAGVQPAPGVTLQSARPGRTLFTASSAAPRVPNVHPNIRRKMTVRARSQADARTGLRLVARQLAP